MANLFRPTHPQQPVACLFLVENSAKMFPKWADLKDQYLFKLVDALAGHSVPVSMGYPPFFAVSFCLGNTVRT